MSRARPVVVALTSMLGASPSLAQDGPVMHELGTVVARSPAFLDIPQPITMRDGRILIAGRLASLGADSKRVLLMFDSVMQHAEAVRNSGAVADTMRGDGQLMRLRGDSLMMLDGNSGALVVIDPNGRAARVFAPPTISPPLPPGAVNRGTPPPFTYARNFPMSSPSLGLVFRVDLPPPPLAPFIAAGTLVLPIAGQPDAYLRTEDSVAWLRMHYDTRVIDTIAHGGRGSVTTRRLGPGGSNRGTPSSTALYPFFDEAVAASDGSIAVLHAREYRVDWVMPNGARVTGPRLPYPWRRISDADRERLIDSANTRRRRAYDTSLVIRAADSAAGRLPFTTVTRYTVDTPGGVTERVLAPPSPPPTLVTAGDIPDFFPPTRRGAVLADEDNHVWIRTDMAPSSGPSAWDIVDRDRGVIDRVRLPEGRTIVGFAPGGLVLVAAREAGQVVIEKARVRSP